MVELTTIEIDTFFMKKALEEAEEAMEKNEIPVGCVVVYDGQIISRGHNMTECLTDVTAHAEMIALTAASQYLNTKYLHDCTMYVTLEPCLMCASALRWAQLSRLVYAAPDDKGGFMRYGKDVLHPKTELAFGIMMEESSQLLKDFFKQLRQ